jgi:hypothetical protein
MLGFRAPGRGRVSTSGRGEDAKWVSMRVSSEPAVIVAIKRASRQKMPGQDPHRAFGDPMVCQGRCDGTTSGEREVRGGEEGRAPRVRVAAIAAHSSSSVRRSHTMLTVPWAQASLTDTVPMVLASRPPYRALNNMRTPLACKIVGPVAGSCRQRESRGRSGAQWCRASRATEPITTGQVGEAGGADDSTPGGSRGKVDRRVDRWVGGGSIHCNATERYVSQHTTRALAFSPTWSPPVTNSRSLPPSRSLRMAICRGS